VHVKVFFVANCGDCKSCPFVQGHCEINRCQKDGMMLIAPIVYSSVNLSPTLTQVLSSMVRDDKSSVARNDPFKALAYIPSSNML